MLIEADLPDDVEALRTLVLVQARELDALKGFQAEVERLKAIITVWQCHRFGRGSEQLDPDQFELALEEVETALAEAEHAPGQGQAVLRPINRTGSIAARSQLISNGSNRSSMSWRRPALAAAVSFIRLAKMWQDAFIARPSELLGRSVWRARDVPVSGASAQQLLRLG